MNNMLKGLPSYKLYDVFELVFGGLSLISSIISIVGLFGQQGLSFTFWFMVVILTISAAALTKLFKIQKITHERFVGIGAALGKMTEGLKEDYYRLRQQFSRNVLTAEQLVEHARTTCQVCVNHIAEFMTISTGEKINVCIKYFPSVLPRGQPDPKLEEYYVKTLCRSDNSDQDRLSDSLSQVGNNTDFYLLIKERWRSFHAQDLRTYSDHLKQSGYGPYQNSTPSWQDHYLTTIVVPIHVKRKFLTIDSSDGEYDLLGFLCADSLSTSAFPEKHMKTYINIMEGFASMLYPYFERLHTYLNKIDPSGG